MVCWLSIARSGTIVSGESRLSPLTAIMVFPYKDCYKDRSLKDNFLWFVRSMAPSGTLIGVPT